jgi:hypothetical protein
MTGTLYIHQQMSAETLEKLRARFQRQAEFPSSVADNIQAIRHTLADPETRLPDVMGFLDAMSSNSMAALENSRRIWEVMGKATISNPDGKKGRLQ